MAKTILKKHPITSKPAKRSPTVKQRNNSEAKAKKIANLKPFQPGQSGNPKGRPKSSLTSIIREVLLRENDTDKEKRSFAECIVSEVCRKAAQGDLKAAELVWNRMEGKPEQALELRGGDFMRDYWLGIVESLAAKYRKPREQIIADLCARNPQAAQCLQE